MSLNRLQGIRRSVIAHIHKKEKKGHWCCDLKCMWVDDPHHVYDTKQKNADYSYLRIINNYYDRLKNELANIQL